VLQEILPPLVGEAAAVLPDRLADIFIDARFWDAKKAKRAITIITRMKANLRIDSTEDLGVDTDPVNAEALRRQARRQAKHPAQPAGTDRPEWTEPLFRYTAKVSRQVLRFFKHCFLKPVSPALYERELRPFLTAYL